MRTILLAAFVLTGATGRLGAATNEPPAPPPVVELSLKQRIAQTVIPEIHMDNAAPQRVIEWLRDESHKYTPDKTAINVVWQVPPAAKLRPVTLNLRTVPLNDVLGFVTQAAGLAYRVERYAVVVYVPSPAPTDKPGSNAQSK